MYSPVKLTKKYIQYYWQANNSKGHGMHSPFVFGFITKVLNDTTAYKDYARVEAMRQALLQDHTVIEVQDFGAGSVTTNSNQRKISAIARHAAKPKKFGQLLYRMVQFYKPQTILELGTSLGITSAYLALGNPQGRLITLEGAPAIATAAQHNFTRLQLQNTEQVVGPFENTLDNVLAKNTPIDFAFLDGNHRLQPTLDYFEQLLPHIHNDTILVFDDIHWSLEMEEAWQQITAHEAVRCSIDLFFVGVVLFRKEFLEKQHFAIRF